MTRVKIKSKGTATRERKIKLLEVLCSNGIHVTKIFTAFDGFAVLLLNEDHADTIFSTKIKEELQKYDFQPLLPPELKVKKSVIVTRLEDLIYERDEEAIKQELINNNTWIDDIEAIYKFPRSSTIKITFTHTAAAKTCTEKGFLAFNISVAPHDVKHETYIPIQWCMRCYVLEHHNTRDCPKPREYKICSECGKEGHVWHQCQDKENKRCINCNGNHSALAMKCAKRKEVLKEKRKEEAEKNKRTYAAATAVLQTQTTNTQPITYSPPIITREDTLKINICVAHAHYMNIDKPGSYEEELNKVLKLNNLPCIKIPSNPTSKRIFNTQDQNPDTSKAAQETKPRRIKEKIEENRETTETAQAQATDGEIKRMEEELFPTEAADIDLQFFTTEEKGWPQRNFSLDDLIKGIYQSKYKYTYADIRYTEEDVLDFIKNGEIKLSKCWNSVGKDTYRKIRNGLLQERSPLEERDSRHRRITNNN